MEIDFEKLGGLVPAIIQDAVTKNVLMLGFMNQEAYDKTIATKKVTFWSRSRNCLWTKGETSGNFLNLVSIQNDCDNDTLLVLFFEFRIFLFKFSQAFHRRVACATLPQRYRHLLGRRKYTQPNPLSLRASGLHQQAPRRNARGKLHYQPLQERR